MNRLLIPFISLLCLLLGSHAGLAADYTVSFNQIVEHPALDALRQGVKDELSARNYKVQYHEHIAQGNIATAQACAQAIKRLPIVFAAVTDRMLLV